MHGAVVAVVGSGMSGCAVAAELARHGVPAAIFEAGPDAGADHVASRRRTISLLDPARDDHFAPFDPESVGPHYSAGCGMRRRVGGRSLYWRGICLRIEAYALADWPPAVRDALERTLYRDVERDLERWAGRPLDAVRGKREGNLLATVTSLGYASAQPTPRAVRRAQRRLWDVYSPLGDVPRSAIRPDRAVVRVDPLADGRVEVHVAEPKGLSRVRARAAVLCAGSVENARLASGVAERERAAGNGVFRVVDHHVQGWVAVTARRAATADASVLALRDVGSRSNLFLEACGLDGLELLDAWAMGEQVPSASSAVSFRDAEPPRFDVRLDRADLEVLAGQERLLRELAEALGVPSEQRPGRLEDVPEFEPAVERARWTPGRAVPYYCRLGTLNHEAGSLALGGPFVDATGRLRGAESIFVAGPAAFPRPGAANPGLTILALGRLVARNVLSAL